jgi:hypothetical protein
MMHNKMKDMNVTKAINRQTAASRWGLVAAATALALLVGACVSAESGNLEDPTDPVAPTQPASVAALLTVDTPQVGDLFESPSLIKGETSSLTVGYRLSAGDKVLTEGTVSAADGAFATVVEFTNACCVEMVLEVFQPSADGLALTIPLAFPESG